MDRSTYRVALCQINPTVGDLKGNTKKIIDNIARCRELGAGIVAFPELAVTGYPPEDLLLKPSFIKDNISCIKEIASHCDGMTAIVGFVNKLDGELFNSAAVIQNKKIVSVYDKICLPNYGVFDEKRYFSKGSKIAAYRSGGLTFGISICEDLWDDKSPAKILSKAGVDLMIAINASPFYTDKWKERIKIAKALKTSVAYVNLVGGQDELVFDGHSFVTDKTGKVVARGKQFDEDIVIFDMEGSGRTLKNIKPVVLKPEKTGKKADPGIHLSEPVSSTEEVYKALCLGLTDYVRKNGFKKVILGLSGGIDSALVAAIAADALGPDNVKALFMPSQYTSGQSRDDAFALARNLGIECKEISIVELFSSYLKTLEPHFAGTSPDISEENLQARIRGNLLMAFSNKFGHLVLATGNKSEVSTGYATLYGDMAGGLSVIKDVPKMLVYELSRFRNTISDVIPRSIIDRAPTAELKPDQKDRDTLPPYEVLDKLIHLYVEMDKSAEDIIKTGLDKELVHKMVRMIDKSEYKRRQGAPGIKITPKSFGKDRRVPITNKYPS